MSIDRAWTLTVGSPEVKIAVIDSGIEWDHPDLAAKAYLNAAELTGDRARATGYYRQLLEIAREAEAARPELVTARAFVAN